MMIDYTKISLFMEEYTSFFESMVDAEKTKLSILLSNDLVAIEKNILEQQVNAKKMENIENRRIALFKQFNLQHLSLKEMIDELDEDKIIIKWYYERLDKAISDIKYLNKKSMDIIKFNLKMVESRTNKEYGYDVKGVR